MTSDALFWLIIIVAAVSMWGNHLHLHEIKEIMQQVAQTCAR